MTEPRTPPILPKRRRREWHWACPGCGGAGYDHAEGCAHDEPLLDPVTPPEEPRQP
jgi:hypothetical protein